MIGIARRIEWALPLLVLLSACSGGGETGTGLSDSGDGGATNNGTGKREVIIGALSNISSNAIVVNGNIYETGTSSIVVSNTSGSKSDLAVGLVVAIDANSEEAGHQGTAREIAFENEVEGIVLANDYPDSLNVMGQVVLINNDTVFESHVSGVASIKDIRKKDHVEVSGFPTDDGSIYATHVVVKSTTATDNQIVVKGKVLSLSTVDHKFNLGRLPVSYLESSLAGEITELLDGMPVKVIGHLGFKGNNNEVLFAEQILPLSYSGFQFEGTQIEIEGIAATDLLIDEFVMCRINVRVTDVTSVIGGELSEIRRGRKLRASGVIDKDNKLVADSIVFMHLSTVSISGSIDAIDYDANTVNVFGRTFHVSADTLMRHDDSKSSDTLFSLDSFSVGDSIELKAYRDVFAMDYVATRIDASESKTARISGQIDDILVDTLTMKDFVIDVSALPPGQLKPGDIGRKIELSVNYISPEQALVATGYEYED